jgi:molybdopterin-binding protein
LAGTIEKIVSDKVVSEVVVRTGASIITTGSVERMNVKQGENVFAIIKATEVSVEKEQVLDHDVRLSASTLIAVRPRQPICGRRIRQWCGRCGPNRSSGAGREFRRGLLEWENGSRQMNATLMRTHFSLIFAIQHHYDAKEILQNDLNMR